MRYHNLEEMLRRSSSTRQYFLSLSPALQIALHRYDENIHTAAQLHDFAQRIEHKRHTIE